MQGQNTVMLKFASFIYIVLRQDVPVRATSLVRTSPGLSAHHSSDLDLCLHAHPNPSQGISCDFLSRKAASNAGFPEVNPGSRGMLNNLAEDVKLTCYEFFGCILISLSPQVVFFTQQCRTYDFDKLRHLVVDGSDSEDQWQVRSAACQHCREHHIFGTIISSASIGSCTG